jgi:hypothetical protein
MAEMETKPRERWGPWAGLGLMVVSAGLTGLAAPMAMEANNGLLLTGAVLFGSLMFGVGGGILALEGLRHMRARRELARRKGGAT